MAKEFNILMFSENGFHFWLLKIMKQRKIMVNIVIFIGIYNYVIISESKSSIFFLEKDIVKHNLSLKQLKILKHLKQSHILITFCVQFSSFTIGAYPFELMTNK